MTEPMIRGHVIAHTARFARTHFDLSNPYGLAGSVSSELNHALETMTGAGWYPRRYQVELLDALAEARGRSDTAYGDLLLCGSALASVENQFMNLLVRVITPELFVKKLGLFWKRDHQSSGALELEQFSDTGNHARLKLSGVSGYDHAAVLWLGWIKRVLDGVCGGRASVAQSGWSWNVPGPSDVVFDVRWS